MTKRTFLIDCGLAILAFVVGAMAAAQFVRTSTGLNYYFDWTIVPATMIACGHGFSQPAQVVPELQAFAANTRFAFDCGALPPGLVTVPASPFASGTRYGVYAVALSLKLRGTDWSALHWHLSVVYGVSSILTYVLLRLFCSWPLAIAGAIMLTCSVKLTELTGYRDYIKEAPFLALLAVVLWVCLRERTKRQAWSGAAIAGVLMGIGIGCRIDLLVFAPFVGLSLLALVRWAKAEGGIVNRLAAVAIFLGAFVVSGLPILTSISGGSSIGHHVLLGFTSQFSDHLGLVNPAYDVGELYSDGYAYTLIAAQARVRDRDLGPMPFGGKEYDAAGVKLAVDIGQQFPADMLTRTYGAVLQSVRFPFTAEGIVWSRNLPAFKEPPTLQAIARTRAAVLGPLTDYGLWIMAAALVLLAAVDLRLATLALAAVLYFCGYAVLQYFRRHSFHLDVFPIMALLFLLQSACTLVVLVIRRPRSEWPPVTAIKRGAVNAAGFVVVSAVVLAAALWLLRSYQTGHVTAMIDSTLTAPKSVLNPVASPAGEFDVLLQDDRLGERLTPGPAEGDRDVRMEYLVVELRGGDCEANQPVPLRLKYTGVNNSTDKQFDRDFKVVTPAPGDTARVLAPAFYEYGHQWIHFDGIVVPRRLAGCVSQVSRIDKPGDLPFPFLYATLDPQWRESRLYQRFKWEAR
ncbi:MAG: hypothetical protein Q8T13_00505 [Acidobacteriota bacterium]|nr:hypothetical protein [Acidobacteriota bacterium]